MNKKNEFKVCSTCKKAWSKSDKSLWATRKIWGFSKASWICKECALKAKLNFKNLDYQSLYALATGGDDYLFQVERAKKELSNLGERRKFYKKLRKQGNFHADILKGWSEIGVDVSEDEAESLKNFYEGVEK